MLPFALALYAATSTQACISMGYDPPPTSFNAYHSTQAPIDFLERALSTNETVYFDGMKHDPFGIQDIMRNHNVIVGRTNTSCTRLSAHPIGIHMFLRQKAVNKIRSRAFQMCRRHKPHNGVSVIQRGHGTRHLCVNTHLNIIERTMNKSDLCSNVAAWSPAKYILAPHGANIMNAMFLTNATKCMIEVFPENYYTNCYLGRNFGPPGWVQVQGTRVCNTSSRKNPCPWLTAKPNSTFLERASARSVQHILVTEQTLNAAIKICDSLF